MISLTFDRVWIDTTDQCFHVCVDAYLVHSGGEMFSKVSVDDGFNHGMGC